MSRKIQKLLICSFIAFGLLSCRTRSANSRADLLTMETSDALDVACDQDLVTAEPDDIINFEHELDACLKTGEFAHSWSQALYARFKAAWPVDYLARGDRSVQCLERLTNGTISRYLETMATACKKQWRQRDEISTAIKNTPVDKSCFNFISMTKDGCFNVEACPGQKINARDFDPGSNISGSQFTLCSENIQKIHHIKDPLQDNFLYNYAFVSELTGKQSYKRTTYGAPNCHGTAQAAAGGLLDDLRLTGITHARDSNKINCEPASTEFFNRYKTTPVGSIPMNPGGLLINMNYGVCDASECGNVNLWVDSCEEQKLILSTFVDGMCVKCWEKKLADRGLLKQTTNYTAPQIRKGCILTANDHSVIILDQSAGMCFYYEATSPYGPPQVRATPCAVLNDQFSGQYCPTNSSIKWTARQSK